MKSNLPASNKKKYRKVNEQRKRFNCRKIENGLKVIEKIFTRPELNNEEVKKEMKGSKNEICKKKIETRCGFSYINNENNNCGKIESNLKNYNHNNEENEFGISQKRNEANKYCEEQENKSKYSIPVNQLISKNYYFIEDENKKEHSISVDHFIDNNENIKKEGENQMEQIIEIRKLIKENTNSNEYNKEEESIMVGNFMNKKNFAKQTNQSIENSKNMMRSKSPFKFKKHISSDEMYIVEILKSQNTQQILPILTNIILNVNLSKDLETKILNFLKDKLSKISNNITIPFLFDHQSKDDRFIVFDEWPVFYNSILILKKYLTRNFFSKEIFFQIFTENVISNIFERIVSRDVKERTVVFLLSELIVNRIPEYTKIYLKCLINEIIKIIHSKTATVGIQEILKFSIFSLQNFTDLNIDIFLFECILPLFKKNINQSNGIEFIEILKIFISKKSETIKIILSYIIRSLDSLSGYCKELIVKFLEIIIEYNGNILIENDLLNHFCIILCHSIESSYYSLVESVCNLFLNEKCYLFLKNNSNFILTKIFDSIYNLSKKYWNKKDICQVLNVINLLMVMNRECFENCLRNYNLKKYQEKYPSKFLKENIVLECFKNGLLRNNSETINNVRKKSTVQLNEDVLKNLKRRKY
ncbi:serine/threonine protein phosphatase 2A [Hamiltosporidium magnivora]|uniref:Serine/threonine protein phosphatase 2A n=1 Tax=Hamiltosporidium magnivora TaxID=148818 RepID=A0A4Q9LMP1_9MICR|nr:serine/threonine protein phosphatase 2A [Hamiltosporidium magnivora]